MSDLPHGIVTFLFTDIEGSTRLWEHDADLMWDAIVRHNAILDSAISANRGFHFKTIGDAYQAAFADPVDAVNAVINAQRRLAAEAWESTGPIRVRMALHSGEATPTRGDYLAPCLNRLARLLSTGHGGQVLLSDTVRARVAERLPEGVTLRDLGMHRLRDLLEPERVSQIVVEGLPDQFPPLKSLERHPTNLPIQPNPLVGRTRELAAITGLLAGDDVRLVTLTGVGGTGKTRLALQAGAELLDAFFDGVFFVDLVPVSSPDLVIPTIAASLGVRETGGLSLVDALANYLDGKHALLILDNFEHVLAAAPEVAGLLERCDDIRVLVTSRERLNVRAERELVIDPLPVPTRNLSLQSLAETDAVTLFLQRAAAVEPGFALTPENADSIAQICAHLDGIPLAIELAASRIRSLSPKALLERLDRRLDTLTNGPQDLPARQRTLRETIAWSHALLPLSHRVFFDRLSVFNGGFEPDAARDVAGVGHEDALDVLTSLLDRSLVRRVDGRSDVPRFTMLETLREFGLEELEKAHRADHAREAHASWCVALAETASAKITGPEQSTWLERLELEHDNMRAALAWTNTPERQDLHRRLVLALSRFWLIRGHFTEGRRWVDATLETIGPEPRTSPDVQLVNFAGSFALTQGDFAAAKTRYMTALDGARSLEDKRLQAALHNNLGNVWMRFAQPMEAEPHYERALELAEELGDDFMRANVLGNLGGLAHARGDVDGALTRYTACLGLWRTLGNVHGEVPMLLNIQLLLAPHTEHADRARQFGERCLETSRKIGDRWNEALALMGMGQIEDARENLEGALAWYTQSLETLRALETREWIRSLVGYIGVVVLDQGDIERGVALLIEKLDTDPDLESMEVTLDELAVALLAKDARRPAAIAMGAAQGIRDKLGYPVQSQCKRRHDRSLAILRSHFGPSLDAVLAEGRERPVREIVDEIRSALQGNLPDSPRDEREKLFADLDALLAEPPL